MKLKGILKLARQEATNYVGNAEDFLVQSYEAVVRVDCVDSDRFKINQLRLEGTGTESNYTTSTRYS